MSVTQNWDGVTAPAIPSGWTASGFCATVASGSARSAPNALTAITSGSVQTCMSSAADATSGAVSVAATAVPLAHAPEVLLVARASTTNWTTMSAYCLDLVVNNATSLANGINISKNVSGTLTALTSSRVGQGQSTWALGTSYALALECSGSTLSAYAQRLSDGAWLQSSGLFQCTARVACATVTDSSISGSGRYGHAFFFAGASGDALFDDFVLAGLGVSASGSATPTTVSATATPSWGLAPYTYQWYRSTSSGFTPGGGTQLGNSGTVSGATGTTLAITGDPNDTTSYYVCRVTDAASTVADSAQIALRTTHAATTYYVDPAGSDAAAGTSTAAPWQTISKVNGWTFVPGDTIAFLGGQTFAVPDASTPLVVQQSGTASAPITLTSYGSGRATISQAGAGGGIKVLDAAYVTVSGLIVSGPDTATLAALSSTAQLSLGQITSTGFGIAAESTTTAASLAQPQYLRGVHVTGCLVQGFRWAIVYRARPALSVLAAGTSALTGTWIGYQFCRISSSEWAYCTNGLYTWGLSDYTGNGDFPYLSNNQAIHRDLAVSDCNAHDLYGYTGSSYTDTTSGAGIRLCNVTGAVIERTRVANVGHKNATYQTAAGIESEASSNLVARSCEVSGVHMTGATDGMGVDLFDGNTSSNTVEYCYVHDCDGPGIGGGGAGAFGASSGHSVRYCVLQNNQRAQSNASGEIGLFGTISSLVLAHNTLVNTLAATAFTRYAIGSSLSSDALVRNNILSINPTATAAFVPAANTLALMANWRGNCYDAQGASFTIGVGGSTYTTLAGVQAASATVGTGTSGWEVQSGVATGAVGDPVFAGTRGGGAAQLPASPASALGTYDLGASSPAIGCGAFVAAGDRDFHDHVTNASSRDAGACQPSAQPGAAPRPLLLRRRLAL